MEARVLLNEKSLHEGDLIELRKNDASIRGHWDSIQFFTVKIGPTLILDYNLMAPLTLSVPGLLEQGWRLSILEPSPERQP